MATSLTFHDTGRLFLFKIKSRKFPQKRKKENGLKIRNFSKNRKMEKNNECCFLDLFEQKLSEFQFGFPPFFLPYLKFLYNQSKL